MSSVVESKVLVIELNEVPSKVVDTFIQRHPNAAFARIMATAGRIRTAYRKYKVVAASSAGTVKWVACAPFGVAGHRILT